MKANSADGHWLNQKRVTAYARMLLVVMAATCVGWLVLSRHMVDRTGSPVGNDFVMLWAASLEALRGHARDAYSVTSLFGLEQLAVPGSQKVFGWFYPPMYFLFLLPLAKLPYLVAYGLWALATLALFVAVLRRVVSGSVAMWCVAAYPGIWMNLMDGQNGLLTAALAGAAMLCLPRRPYIAGVLLGLLAIKPHLGLLFGVALLAIGAWRVLAAATVTVVAFTGLALAVVGRETLPAWLGSLGMARMLLERGGIPLEKMPTVFAMARLWGASVGWAYGLHALVAGAAVALVWRVWRGSSDWRLRGAALMAATMLVSPYLYDYDLAWLAFPIAWMCVYGLENGWLRGERELLVVAFVLPLVSTALGSAVRVEIGPLVGLGMLLAVDRRMRMTQGSVTFVRSAG